MDIDTILEWMNHRRVNTEKYRKEKVIKVRSEVPRKFAQFTQFIVWLQVAKTPEYQEALAEQRRLKEWQDEGVLCPECKAGEMLHAEYFNNRFGQVERFECSECGHTFNTP
jgi:Zn ribbon nucleic-acid-binding protein